MHIDYDRVSSEHQAVLTREEYEETALMVLMQRGLDWVQARNLIADRFPLCMHHAATELKNRGLTITLAHVQEYLLTVKAIPPAEFNDPAKVMRRIMATEWTREKLEDLATFLQRSGRN